MIPALVGTAVVSVLGAYGLFLLTAPDLFPQRSSRRSSRPADRDSSGRSAATTADRDRRSIPAGQTSALQVGPAVSARPSGPLSYVELVKRAGPTVVHISTLRDFAASPLYHWMPRGRHRQTGLGTGFIIRKDGLILTNNHVIRGADVIMVRLSDDREFRARVVGTDPETDIALIKIDAKKPLPTAILGDSDKLEIGEPVVAIGNPFGLDHTVTAGIVSAKGRRNVTPGGQRSPYWNFIQTDASINPGNSGGPLLNMKAEVVGINSAIDSRGAGIGFAIPINMAKVVVPLLEKHGRAPRAWLGVAIQPVTSSLQRSLGLSSRKGALVAEVVPDSPAARAGILPGDVIVEFNGKPVKVSADLPWLAAIAGIGKKVDVVLFRGGKRYRLQVVMAPRNPADQPGAVAVDLGMSLAPVSRDVARLYGISPGLGLVVTDVQRSGPAHAAGIARGEVILRVGRRLVRRVSDFRRALSRYRRGQLVPLLVTSSRGTRWLQVPKR